tara:strand:+ start:27384 stop:28238 length:855 start_codon:yes stop_codon:yes gene_type:complete
MRDDFCIFILTHGRPDNVATYQTLSNCGYTGKTYLVVDDKDETLPEYVERYGQDKVLVFSKDEIAQKMDQGDNFSKRSVVFARNASFDLAEQVGCEYFMQLDDDYTSLHYKSTPEGHYTSRIPIRSLDEVLEKLIEFYQNTPTKTIAFAQDGDFIGGENGKYGLAVQLTRKAMNSFLCSTKRRFWFMGQLNDDVNTYTSLTRKGDLFFTYTMLSLLQRPTQTNAGGLTELYLDAGTYVKSFYTIMYEPSTCTVQPMEVTDRRLHHRLDWNAIEPKILNEKHKKL